MRSVFGTTAESRLGFEPLEPLTYGCFRSMLPEGAHRRAILMKKIRSATEDEMVLAFLRAEIDSPRFSNFYRAALAHLRLDQSYLSEHADLHDDVQNEKRSQLLGMVRGYKKDALLFRGFPNSVQWTEVELEPNELGGLRYARWQTLIDLTRGTRLVADGAKNIDSIITSDNINENIKALAEAVHRGKRCPELILAHADDGSAILIEGHARATAYVLAQIAYPVRAFLGSSPMMARWAVY